MMRVKPVKKYGKGEPIKALKRKIRVTAVKSEENLDIGNDIMSEYDGAEENFPPEHNDVEFYGGLPTVQKDGEM